MMLNCVGIIVSLLFSGLPFTQGGKAVVVMQGLHPYTTVLKGREEEESFSLSLSLSGTEIFSRYFHHLSYELFQQNWIIPNNK